MANVSQSFLDQRKKVYGGQTSTPNNATGRPTGKVSDSFLQMRQKVYSTPAPKPVFTQNRIVNTATAQKPKQKYSFWEEVQRFGQQFADASKDVIPNLKVGFANYRDVMEEQNKKNREIMNKPVEKGSFLDKYNLGRLFPNYEENRKSMDESKKKYAKIQEEQAKKRSEDNKKLKEGAYKELSKNQAERAKKFGTRQGAGGIADDVAASAPSLVTSAGLAIVSGLITKNPQVALALGFSTSYAQGSSEIYKQARDFGVDDKQATKLAHTGGIAMGALDTVPIGRLIEKSPMGNTIKKKIQSNVLKSLMSVGIQGGLESSTEVAQEVLQNAIAKTYNEDQKLFEGIDRVAISSFILGAGADVATSAVGKGYEKIAKQPQSSEEALQMATEKIAKIVNKEKRTAEEEMIYETVGKAHEKETLFGEGSGEQLVQSASQFKDADTFAKEVFGTTKTARVGFMPDAQIRVQTKINPQQVQQYLNEIAGDVEIEPVSVRLDGEEFITNNEDYKVAAFRVLKKPVPVIIEDESTSLPIGSRFRTIEELFSVVKDRQRSREDFNIKAGLNPDGSEKGSDRQQFDESNEIVAEKLRQMIRRPKEYRSDLEREAFDEVEKSPTKFANAYLKKSRTDNYINSDDILPLLGDKYKGHNETELRRVAASVRDMVFNTWLEERQGTKNNTVMFVVAGPGSGKTTYFEKASSLGEDSPVQVKDYPIVLETFLNGSNAKKIHQATEKGYKVEVLYILRHPLDAWKDGVLPRVKEQGRTVEESVHMQTHKGELDQIVRLYDKYKDNKEIEFAFVDNTGAEAKETTIDFIRKFSYNSDEVLKQMKLETDKAYEQKQLTKEQFEATTKGREPSSEISKSAESSDQGKEKVDSGNTAVIPREKVTRENSSEVEVDPARLTFTNGKEGDIYRSYSADTLPDQKVRRPFTYNGKSYIATGLSNKVQAWELVPVTEYKGETYKYGQQKEGQFGYEGMLAKSKGIDYALSNPITFAPKGSVKTEEKVQVASTKEKTTKLEPSKEELTLKPSKATTKEEDIQEKVKVGFNEEKLRMGNTKTIPTPRIRKADIKTLIQNSDEFKANPVLTVRKAKRIDFSNGPDGQIPVDLVFEGKKAKFTITSEALGINPENLKEGDKIRVENDALKGTGQQMRVYKGKGVFASVGEYAELPNMTTDKIGDGTVPEVEPTFVPFPEVVRLVKEITGKYPIVKKKMGMRRGDAQPSTLRIRLAADIFSDLNRAAKTLSHELGHIMDFLPQGTARKGNLLSRIASLNNYLKHTLKEFPDSTLGELTKKDRDAIRKRAKELSKKSFLVTEEVVVGEKPITVDEIKAIWNDVMSTFNDKELLAYIKTLDDKQKAQLVRAAMNGKVPEWVTFKRQIKDTITHEVIRNAPEDIKKLYQKMLRDEILARRLFELNTIKTELWNLSKKWRPFNEKWAGESFMKYRKSSEELYADAISVLFNDPARLRIEAPEFWRGFFNYIDQKPEVKENMFAIWDMLNQSEDVKMQQRLNDMYEGFEKAKEKRKAIELEKPLTHSFIERFMKQHITRFDPIYRKLKPKFASFGLEISPLTETRMQLEEMQMRRNESYLYLDKVNKEIIRPLEQLGLSEDDLGILLKLERNLGDRKDIANPYGLQGEYAAETLAYFQEHLAKNKNITPEQFGILQQAAVKFREMMFKRVELATKYELYGKKFFEETALPNKNTYVTYQVVDYIHDNYVSAGIKQAVGTLKEVENPVTSSILKTLAVIEQTEIQKAKLKVVKNLHTNFPDDISAAEAIKPKGVRVGWKPVKDRAVLELFVDGKIQGVNVDPYIKEMFDLYTGTELHTIARVSGKFNQIFKPIVTTYNLSWGFFSNISRDSRRTYKNLTTVLPAMGKKSITLREFITTWITSVPQGYSFQRGKITPQLEEMLQNKAFSTPFTSFDPTANEESSLAPILRKYNFLPELDADSPQWKQAMKKYLTPIRMILKGIEFAGSTLETTSKVAGYQMVKKRIENGQQAGYIVRNYVGTPNYMDGGTQKQVDNNVFVFSNVMAQALRTDLELATDPKTRSGYMMRTLMIDILPKIAMLAVAAGLFGDDLKDQMEKATEYDKTNYLIIPMGTRENGKANYFRIPQDETGRLLSAMVWKIGSFLNGDLKKPEQVLSLGAGFIPSVTPIWTVAEGWLNYAQGRNPYDSYRGRLVIDDTTWTAGGLPVFEKMVKWTTNEVGLSQFTTYSDETDTTFDYFLKGTPIINRMIKSTDYGLKEKEKELEKKIDSEKAQNTLKEREILREYTEKGKKATTDEERKAIRKEFYHTIIGEPPYDSTEKAKRTRLKAKFDIAVVRGEVSREMDQLIDADTNDYKVALLREWKRKMDSTEYEKLIRSGRENHIISDELKKRLKKESLWYLLAQ